MRMVIAFGTQYEVSVNYSWKNVLLSVLASFTFWIIPDCEIVEVVLNYVMDLCHIRCDLFSSIQRKFKQSFITKLTNLKTIWWIWCVWNHFKSNIFSNKIFRMVSFHICTPLPTMLEGFLSQFHMSSWLSKKFSTAAMLSVLKSKFVLARTFFKFENRWKSDGTKLKEYGGYWRRSKPLTWIVAMAITDLCIELAIWLSVMWQMVIKLLWIPWIIPGVAVMTGLQGCG